MAYYLLVVGCPLGIAVGAAMFIGLCVMLVRFERKRKQTEERRKAILAKRAQNKQNKIAKQ